MRPVEETELARRLRRNPNLSETDVAVIALAAMEGGVAVMDERYGRATADTEGVETRGTVSNMVAAVGVGHLSTEGAVDLLDATIYAGWYCSTDLNTRIVRRLRSLA